MQYMIPSSSSSNFASRSKRIITIHNHCMHGERSPAVDRLPSLKHLRSLYKATRVMSNGSVHFSYLLCLSRSSLSPKAESRLNRWTDLGRWTLDLRPLEYISRESWTHRVRAYVRLHFPFLVSMLPSIQALAALQ